MEIVQTILSNRKAIKLEIDNNLFKCKSLLYLETKNIQDTGTHIWQ